MFRPKRRVEAEVELNVTAILDMAFQLLAFFVLTFKAAPLEEQIRLHLPPPNATASKPGISRQPGDDPRVLSNLTTLIITVCGDKDGAIDAISVGDRPVANPKVLAHMLDSIFSDVASPFEQIIVQVGSNVRYQGLMEVIDSCVKAKLPGGERLSKLSFVELPLP